MERNFCNQHNDSDIKRCGDIRKLTTGQGKYYTIVCFSDYDYIKNHDRLNAIHLR